MLDTGLSKMLCLDVNFAASLKKPNCCNNIDVLFFLSMSKLMNSKEPRAVIRVADDGLFIGITPSNHAVALDTDSARHSAPSPMELLLLALGSCTAVDVISILRKKQQSVTEYRVEVRGQRRNEHPRSFRKMEVHHIVTGRSVSEQSVAQAITLSEQKYCSVAATLKPTAEIVSTFEIIEG
jgi:putative redox protein